MAPFRPGIQTFASTTAQASVYVKTTLSPIVKCSNSDGSFTLKVRKLPFGPRSVIFPAGLSIA